MNKRILCALMCLGIFSAAGADAKDISEKQRQALNNLHQEISDCAMYFHISSEGVIRVGSNRALTISHRSTKWKDHLVSFGSEIGKIIGMTKREMTARSKLSFDGQMTEIGNDFANYSVLLKKRLAPCAALIKNLNDRVDQAMDR